MRISLKKSVEKANVPYDSVDVEKVIKVLFFKFSLSMLNTLTLEIPQILMFDPDEQRKVRDKFLRSIEVAYRIFHKVHRGYVSPQQRYVQAFQDIKNITLLVLEQYLYYGQKRVSTPEAVLEQISKFPDDVLERYWEDQDFNLQNLEKNLNTFIDRMITDEKNKVSPVQLLGTDMGMQIFPLIHGDKLFELEFKKILYEMEQNHVKISKMDSSHPLTPANFLRLNTIILNRPKEVEDFLKREFSKVFPLEILLKIIEFYENYLNNCAPIMMHLIDNAPIKSQIALFRFLLQQYYYSPFTKLPLAQLRTAIIRVNLDLSALNQLIYDPVTHTGTYFSGLNHIQLRPLFQKNGFIYINGSILWESFLCYIDSVFKQPAFGVFKGLVLESEIANIVYLHDLQPYNIIISNHPAADSNVRYQALLKRDKYPVDPRYKRIYKSPHRIHLKFTDAPFFKTHSFVEFDVCFLLGNTFVVLECKNQPVYSRRDRLDVSILDDYRKLVQLYERMGTYLFEPEIKGRLVDEGLRYLNIIPIIITPSRHIPFSMQFWELEHYLQERGYKINEKYLFELNNTIIETFSVDSELFYYRSPLYERRYQQYCEINKLK